ncbi:MAG: nucleotidyltransferase family protein [Nitrosomonas sp.]
MNSNLNYAALVLAADRTANDPIALKAQVPCKAFAPIDGKPMIIRVLDTLIASPTVKSITLCGPPQALLPECPELNERILHGQIGWITNQNSPSLSAAKGLEQLDPDIPVLLTTADHALLTPEIVEYFLKSASDNEYDATVGAINYEIIHAAFPESKRTVIRLQDGKYCGCNLFAFKPRGRLLVSYWQKVEAQRKRPWKLISQTIGWQAVFKYLLGFLTLNQALSHIEKQIGLSVKIATLPFPEAGVDVDTVSDLMFVEALLKKKAENT